MYVDADRTAGSGLSGKIVQAELHPGSVVGMLKSISSPGLAESALAWLMAHRSEYAVGDGQEERSRVVLTTRLWPTGTLREKEEGSGGAPVWSTVAVAVINSPTFGFRA